MTLVTTTTAAVGMILTGMYVDGKLALYKDLIAWQRMRTVNKLYQKAIKENRLCLYYYFEESVKRRENHICIWSREGNFSWLETYEKANQYGNWFLSMGVQTNELVALCLTNSADLIFAWLGLWSIGAAPALINYNLTGNSLLHCLRKSGAKKFLVDENQDVRTRVEQLEGIIRKEIGMDILIMLKELKQEIYQFDSKSPDDLYRQGVTENSPAAMFYTSGTTGLSKGVIFNINRGLLVGLSQDSRTLTSEDRWYICIPLYHATGGVVAWSALMNGSTVAIGKKFSTTNFWRDVHDSQATWICYVGEIVRYLLQPPPSPQDTDHCVKGILGNGLRPDVWIRFRDRFKIEIIVEFFSSSEGVLSLINYCRGDYLANAVGHHGALTRFATRNIIVPVMVDSVTGEIVRNLDTGFAIRQPYEIGGEIIVKVESNRVFPGYQGDDEATKKKFAHNVFQKGDLWYRSGDSLRRTSDGKWFFMDRLGDTYRWKGENVSTAEVSGILGQYPGIIEANVYGVSLPNHDGKAGCAAIYIDPNLKEAFNYADFLSRSLLPTYAVPIFLRVVKEVSLTHNYKQNKAPLKAEGVDLDKIKNSDEILWIGENGKGSNYRKFVRQDWDNLGLGKARL